MEIFFKTLKSYSRREKIFSSFALGLLMVSSILLFTGKSAGSIEDPGSRKVYSEGVVGEIQRLNPVYTELNAVDADISSLIFSGLARYNAETGEFEEDIATHTLSQDTLTYTFTLKNNVLWQDGEEVTADDILFTYKDVIQSPDFENPVLKANFEGVSIEKVDSRSVTFTLSSPNSFFFSGMTTGLLPKHLLQDIPVSELDTVEFNQNPIGSGPYKVSESYIRNEDGTMSIQLESWENYYNTAPQISHLRFVVFPGTEELLANSSSWHGAAGIRLDQIPSISEQERFKLLRYELPQYTALFLNTDSEALSKNKTRTALYEALDRPSLIKEIGAEVEVDNPLFELTENKSHPANEEAAKTLLEEAGFTAENPLKIRLIRRDFSDTNPLMEEKLEKLVQNLQTQYEAFGIEIAVETYALEELQEKIRKRDYDALLYGQSLGSNLDVFSYWHSSQVSETGLNLSNYQNPRADLLMEQIRSTFDPKKKTELLKELSTVIHNDMPAIFLYTPSYYYAMDSKVSGVSYTKLLRPVDRLSSISSWSLN